jgi:thiamine pyrophosphate-dependent acetolactate synthase large subunit-like protein
MPSDDPMTQERPERVAGGAARFGSDAVAEALAALDIPFIALTPGSSFRGLHDSLVNHLGNRRPALLVCLHEEHAVAIAHGWAKVTGHAMAAAVHSNVGLMHAAMAVFNAWCDRAPVLLIGATGPVDPEKRRPWIDWIHTARDQGALVRGYVKWDDQPASAAAARDAVVRGKWLAEAAPQGPVYVNLDAGLQEAPLAGPLPPLGLARLAPTMRHAPDPELVRQAGKVLADARRPVILAGRVSRSTLAWGQRVALAEALGARVISDLKLGAAFPTEHPLHAGTPAVWPDAEATAALKEADAVLSLDWVDLAGTLQAALGPDPAATIIQATTEHRPQDAGRMDSRALPPVDILLDTEPDAAVAALNAALGGGQRPFHPSSRKPGPGLDPGRGYPGPREADARHEVLDNLGASASVSGMTGVVVTVAHLAAALRRAAEGREVALTHLPLSWDGAFWPFRQPLDYLGAEGGAGIGSGPGITVGAALALKGSGRLAVGICGDGDFLMGATALWTAVRYRIPLLIVVANNRSFYNDEVHQERMARQRGRPVENKWIGQRLADPEIDIAGLARAQGATAFGPITEGKDLRQAFQAAIAAVNGGAVAVVDVLIEPGYTPATATAVGRSE